MQFPRIINQSAGICPRFYDVVRQLDVDGVTVVLVEQFAEFTLNVAQSAVVMTNGTIAHTGPTSDVAERLHDLYFVVSSTSASQPAEPPTGPAQTG